MSLSFTVFTLSVLLSIDSGLAQGSGAYPRPAPPPRASQPDYDLPFRALAPRVASEFRTASNTTYPQPDSPIDGLVAQIQGNGVYGYAVFRPAGSGTQVKVHINSVLTGDFYSPRIYEFPLQNGASCATVSLGALLGGYKVTIVPNQETTFQIPELEVSGMRTLIGRTLMLQNNRDGSTICSVIMPTGPSKMVLQGKFHTPLAGMIYYIQSDLGAAIGTEWMMYSDGVRRDANYVWKLVKASQEDSTTTKQVNHEKTRCATLQGETLATSNQVFLPVSTESPIWRGRMHHGLAPKVVPGDTVYLVVVSMTNGSPVGCTALNRVEPKVGLANFAFTEVQGTIRFVQDSLFEPTLVDIDLKLESSAFSYGIDVLPSLRRRKQEPRKCPNVKETIYNPFHVDPDRVPAQGLGTADQYAVGDLSGKFGTLEKRPQIKLKTWDSNLPLFGYYSVIGRAIVIYGPTGPAVACANIDLNGKPLVTAYATFDYPVQGQFIFRQPENECHSDTYLYIEVSKHPQASDKKSFNHQWHVHENSIQLEENSLSTTSCAQAGGHHNYFNVSVAAHNPIYVRDCNIFTPTRCEIGDLASKLGIIDIPPYKPSQGGKEPEVAKYYWIDSDLPLCGPSKIVDRSLVIHESDFQMPRLSCANLLLYKPK